MINRLPSWVWGGAAMLAGIAGMINAVALMGAFHHGLTHLTGSVSQMGVDLAQGSWLDALHYASLIGCFVLGAILSSVIIRGSNLELGHHYGIALLIESLLLAGATLLLSWGHQSAAYLLSAAAGLQNAMASTYSGAIVRTTHVTGVFTDIGILLGNTLRGQPLEKRKLSLLLVIGIGFSLGGVIGAVLYQQFDEQALWLPVAMTGLAGVIYLAIRLRRRRLPGA